MSTTSAPKKKPTCTNCQVCGHNSKNCPENPFVFYANHKFPKVTQLLSKQLPQKIKTQIFSFMTIVNQCSIEPDAGY